MSLYAKIFETLLVSQRASGVTLAGGKVYFYTPGTVTLKTIYTDRSKQTVAANPYTLSADGTASVYGDGLYDIKLTDASLVQKAYWEDVQLVAASLESNVLGESTYIVGAGDSLMYGLTSPNTKTILSELKANHYPLSLATVVNDGIPGDRLAAMIARYTANIYPLRPSAISSAISQLHVLIGANDFALLTDAQVAGWCSDWDGYCSTARGHGFDIVAYTIPPRLDTADNRGIPANNRRLIMNDYIRKSKNIDALVDLATMFTSADMALTTYVLADTIHFNDAGNTLIARMAAESVSSLGIPAEQLKYLPAGSLLPSRTVAENEILEQAAVSSTSGNATQKAEFTVAVPAIGTGDFTVEFWMKISAAELINNNCLCRNAAGSAGFGVTGASAEYGYIYTLPGNAAVWSLPCVMPDVWNHCVITRDGTDLSYYLNGTLINTVTYATSIDVMNYAYVNVASVSRPRIYDRAFTAGDVTAAYAAFSHYDVSEANYVWCPEDGDRQRGNFIEDASGNGYHVTITDGTVVKIKNPGPRGVVKITTVGNQIFKGAPVGARISSWTMNITVAGGGAIDLSDTNNTGSFYNVASPGHGTGLTDVALTGRFPAAGDDVYVNATGYTISHSIVWELL